MTPEGKVKKAVREVLAKRKAYVFMPVQTGYGAQTLDILACIGGRFVGIEVKAFGKLKGVTERQKAVMAEIEAAGGLAYLIDHAPDLERFLERDLGGARGGVL